MGSDEGAADGLVEGSGVGTPEMYVGDSVGTLEGEAVGLVVGRAVGLPGK